ncbi:hypothetical protein [Bradyrhizobium sp. 192]|uniref:hypothetical protein n=1 Tax=Bradyrhizobium sp. 192 TaxID=2782660 RepID=UPI00200005E0|nr:hypothetical protein [Bradyrhizobium sp. 192]UPJ60503.1 hypothetical protein IVB24_13175 [Bradyrhizobium sp. 192]
MRKMNANDAPVHAWASDLLGNLVTVDDQVLMLLDQLVAMKLLRAWEDRSPSRRHYTVGKRMREMATKISSAASTHPTA